MNSHCATHAFPGENYYYVGRYHSTLHGECFHGGGLERKHTTYLVDIPGVHKEPTSTPRHAFSASPIPDRPAIKVSIRHDYQCLATGWSTFSYQYQDELLSHGVCPGNIVRGPRKY